MGIENLKWWHWVVIALVLGPLGAWIQLQIGPRGNVSQRTTMAPDFFEASALRAGTGREADDDAAPRDLTVYPLDGGAFLATLWAPTQGDQRERVRKNAKALIVKEQEIVAPTPYKPLNPLPNPPHLELSFAVMDRDNRWDDAEARWHAMKLREVRQTGWKTVREGARDPGTGGGAEVEFPLRRAACELIVLPARTSASRAADVSVEFNGKPLGALQSDPSAKVPAWRTAVPAERFVAGRQSLRFVRKPGTQPIALRGIEVVNPQYTVVDFLNDVRQRNTKLAFSYRSSWEPRRAYLYWTVGSLVAVGVAWPLLLKLLIGTGFGRAPAEPEYDLNRFKGGLDRAKVVKPPPPDAEEQLEQHIKAFEEQLEQELTDQPLPRLEPEEVPPLTRVQPARVFSGAVEEPTAGGEPGVDEHKEYGGEFYPVVKKVEHVEKDAHGNGH